jgi:hypothetical protein
LSTLTITPAPAQAPDGPRLVPLTLPGALLSG